MKVSYINKFLNNPLTCDGNTEAQVQRLGNGTFHICLPNVVVHVQSLNQPMPIHNNKLSLEALVYYFGLAKCLGMRQTANLIFPLLHKKALQDENTLLYYETVNIDSYLDLAVLEVNGVRCCIPIPLLSREATIRFLKSKPQMQKKL